MRIVILYRPDSEHARAVETFAHDYQSRYANGRIELINVDSVEGSALAELYDVTSYPSIMVLQDDGSLLHSWGDGAELPLIDEVAGYAYA